MEKFKALSYSTKSTIFFVIAVALAIVAHITGDKVSHLGADIFWGLGLFFWGASYGQRKEGLKNLRKNNLYVSKGDVVG